MIYIFLLIGILLNWGFILHSAMSKPTFEWVIFFKNNWFNMLINLSLSFVIGYNKDLINADYAEFIGVQVNTFTAIFVGYGSGAIWHRIVKKVTGK